MARARERVFVDNMLLEIRYQQLPSAPARHGRFDLTRYQVFACHVPVGIVEQFDDYARPLWTGETHLPLRQQPPQMTIAGIWKSRRHAAQSLIWQLFQAQPTIKQAVELATKLS